DSGHGDPGHESAVVDLIEKIQIALMVSSRQRTRLRTRPSIEFEVKHPTTEEQGHLWRSALGDNAARLNGGLQVLTSQFSLPAESIRSAVVGVKGLSEEVPLEQTLWDQCCLATRGRMDDLSQRIESTASWEDLVLPEAQKEILREIVAHVRQRNKVYESWGF